jgi:hypothetical protein
VAFFPSLPPTRIKFIKLSGFDDIRASSLVIVWVTVWLSSGGAELVRSPEGD